MRTFVKQASPILSLALGGASLAACGDAGLVSGNLMIQNSSQAETVGQVVNIGGRYVDNTCIDPAGAATGVRRVGAQWAEFGAQPVVVLNDSRCQLSVATLTVQDSAGVLQVATCIAPLILSAVGQAAPADCTYTDSKSGKQMPFFVNGTVSPANFSGDFIIAITYSDTPGPVTPSSVPGQWATVSLGGFTTIHVAQPNDLLGVAGLSYVQDAKRIVQSVSGSPTWTVGSVPGQSYSIVSGACPTTLDGAQTAYSQGTQIPVSLVPAAQDLGLYVGADLSLASGVCMIAANCGSGSDICSFEMFDVTLN